MTAAPTLEVLFAFERAHGVRHSEAKEEAIGVELGLSAPRYYQLLGRAIATDAAAVLDPILTRRLRTLRDERRESRDARTNPRKA